MRNAAPKGAAFFLFAESVRYSAVRSKYFSISRGTA